MQGWQRAAIALAFLDSLRIHRTQPVKANWNFIVRPAIHPEVFSAHHWFHPFCFGLSQPGFESFRQTLSKLGIVISRRRGFIGESNERHSIFWYLSLIH